MIDYVIYIIWFVNIKDLPVKNTIIIIKTTIKVDISIARPEKIKKYLTSWFIYEFILNLKQL